MYESLCFRQDAHTYIRVIKLWYPIRIVLSNKWTIESDGII
jgi:hypothetical protein